MNATQTNEESTMKHIPVPVGYKTGDSYTHPSLGDGTLIAVGGVIISSQAGTPMFLSAIFQPEPKTTHDMHTTHSRNTAPQSDCNTNGTEKRGRRHIYSTCPGCCHPNVHVIGGFLAVHSGPGCQAGQCEGAGTEAVTQRDYAIVRGTNEHAAELAALAH